MGVWIAVFIPGIAAACAVGFFAGRKFASDRGEAADRKYLTPVKLFLYGYLVFAGCFVFPFRSALFPLDQMKIYLVAGSYGIIGLGFAGLYGRGKGRLLYSASLFLTALGMGGRYMLEYGEVSNRYNFTAFNVISFLAVVPLITTAVYYCGARWKKPAGKMNVK